MKTNKTTIKHINDILYKSAKYIEFRYAKYDGKVYIEERLCSSNDFSNPNAWRCQYYTFEDNKFVNWLKDYKEILTELNVIDKLVMVLCKPEVKVSVGYPVDHVSH